MSDVVRIGTRGSDLALWQAHFVEAGLKAAGVEVEIVILKTEGDQNYDKALHEVDGTGFFTKEIEEALLGGRIDVAVHSYKDVPTEDTAGLVFAAVPERGPVRDVVIRRVDEDHPDQLWGLAPGATVGTGSLRRRAALLSRRPDLNMVQLRGNVPRRFGKVTSGELDAVVLAEAGVIRLGLDSTAGERGAALELIDIADVCPSPAQGALGLQIRAGDEATAASVAGLHHPPTAFTIGVERQLLGHFGGGCHLPLGALCEPHGDRYRLQALVAAPAGEERLEAAHDDTDPDRLVQTVHAELVRLGAEKYL